MNQYLRNFIITFISLVFALAIFIYSTPYLYLIIPNDFVRTKIIIDKLADSLFNPEVVFFGDSRAMSGVNCNIINDSLQIKSVNLATASQRLNESALFYSQMPNSVRCVVQCIYLQSLKRECNELSEQTVSSLKMFGYELDSITPEIVPQQTINSFESSRLINYYRSRSFFKDGFLYFIRSKLDDDAPSDSIISILHPYMYPSNRSLYTYDRDISLFNSEENPFVNFCITPNSIDILSRANKYFASRGIVYFVLIVPENPDLNSFHSPERKIAAETVINELGSIGVRVIDFNNILESQDFYDAVHLNRNGAQKISMRLIPFIKKILG